MTPFKNALKNLSIAVVAIFVLSVVATIFANLPSNAGYRAYKTEVLTSVGHELVDNGYCNVTIRLNHWVAGTNQDGLQRFVKPTRADYIKWLEAEIATTKTL